MSGATISRPGLQQALAAARAGRYDLLLVYKVDRLSARQVPQAAVAHELGVSRQNVSRWYRRWQQGGEDALRSRGTPGPSPRVTPEQVAEVERVLLAGARAAGFAGDLWTLARVAQVIEQRTGVAHHPGHVWRLLRQLGWSVQRLPHSGVSV
jgi:transposase